MFWNAIFRICENAIFKIKIFIGQRPNKPAVQQPYVQYVKVIQKESRTKCFHTTLQGTQATFVMTYYFHKQLDTISIASNVQARHHMSKLLCNLKYHADTLVVEQISTKNAPSPSKLLFQSSPLHRHTAMLLTSYWLVFHPFGATFRRGSLSQLQLGQSTSKSVTTFYSNATHLVVPYR